jgi:hypothetical protein
MHQAATVQAQLALEPFDPWALLAPWSSIHGSPAESYFVGLTAHTGQVADTHDIFRLVLLMCC